MMWPIDNYIYSFNNRFPSAEEPSLISYISIPIQLVSSCRDLANEIRTQGKFLKPIQLYFTFFLAFYVNSFRVGIYKESYLNLESKTYLQRIYTPYLLFPPKEYQIPHLWQKNRKDKDKIQGKRKFPTYLFTLKNEWVNQRANPFFPPLTS